ncbi:DUF6884 domain-containing protein [Paenibacillus silviterrae]|uniref:DUF6884 domain-containing protein n=1 Tax=Paenibacillus silviterrae TaxID=3242194 RepID=UPI00254348A6|nr:DUF6884 domain-containing protein [Paenibacillus chinjuensis]
MEKRIAFVSCSKKKKSYPCEAASLYAESQLFKFASSFCNTHYDKWFILSAKHGVVAPSDILEPYDQTLKSTSISNKKKWAHKVLLQIQQQFSSNSPVFYFHASDDYVKYLIPLLEDAGYQCVRPLKGLGIGKQQHWYKEALL